MTVKPVGELALKGKRVFVVLRDNIPRETVDTSTRASITWVISGVDLRMRAVTLQSVATDALHNVRLDALMRMQANSEIVIE